jgi:hypothetical protein
MNVIAFVNIFFRDLYNLIHYFLECAIKVSLKEWLNGTTDFTILLFVLIYGCMLILGAKLMCYGLNKTFAEIYRKFAI